MGGRTQPTNSVMSGPELLASHPDFMARWERWYPHAPPVGFLLRESYGDRWLRIHTMQESKRTPSSGWDYAELVRRYNTVAEHVLGDRSPCALVVMHECGASLDSEFAGGLRASVAPLSRDAHPMGRRTSGLGCLGRD